MSSVLNDDTAEYIQSDVASAVKIVVDSINWDLTKIENEFPECTDCASSDAYMKHMALIRAKLDYLLNLFWRE
jgi:hypothetical protein